MNQNLYGFGIFFLGLFALLELVHSAIYFSFGLETFGLLGFAPFWLFIGFVSLLCSLFLLLYCYEKKYWFVFSALIASALSSFYFTFSLYNSLMTRQMTDYILAYQIATGIGFVYAISLVFSTAGKRPLLKTAGVAVFTLNSLLVISFVLEIGESLVPFSVLEKLYPYTLLLAAVVAISFILIFKGEIKSIPKSDPEKDTFWNPVFVLLAVGALFMTFTTGARLTKGVTEASGYVSDKAKILARPFEARKYVGLHGDTLRYRFIKPPDYDSTKRYPLVVCLHHGGVFGDDNTRQVEGSFAAELYQQRTRYPAFLFAPQCPKGANWGGVPGYPSLDSLVFEGMSALEQEFSIDEKKRYVAGVSAGGNGSWYFISTRPTIFAAAVPLCGMADPKYAKDIVDVPIWAFHGEKDRGIPVMITRTMIEAIKKEGGNPTYTEFPGAGHDIAHLVDKTALFDWLFAQHRD